MKALERDRLLQVLEARFEANLARHEGIRWADVLRRLDDRPDTVESLHAMERTAGEPDVVRLPSHAGDVVFVDCAAESPGGRRSLCYDREARVARKEHAPKGSAVESATAMGIELLTEQEYRALQAVGEFDTKTSSWIRTPPEIRALGGALFCDRRYGTVFVYHNGVQSYYAARGFRGALRI